MGVLPIEWPKRTVNFNRLNHDTLSEEVTNGKIDCAGNVRGTEKL